MSTTNRDAWSKRVHLSFYAGPMSAGPNGEQQVSRIAHGSGPAGGFVADILIDGKVTTDRYLIDRAAAGLQAEALLVDGEVTNILAIRLPWYVPRFWWPANRRKALAVQQGKANEYRAIARELRRLAEELPKVVRRTQKWYAGGAKRPFIPPPPVEATKVPTVDDGIAKQVVERLDAAGRGG